MKYRILEKEGTTLIKCPGHVQHYGSTTLSCENSLCTLLQTTYIHRYIVQSTIIKGVHPHLSVTDIKEFSDLEEARKFKRSLELKDGIVIE